MDAILTDTSQSALTTAFEKSVFSLFELFKKWPQAEVLQTPELFRTITNIQFPLFNSVMQARLPSGAVDDTIDFILAEYKARQVPFMWWIGPTTQPTDLGAILVKRGFLESANPGMAVDLALLAEHAALPKNLRVKRVEGEEELDRWNRVVSAAFGMPDFVAEAFFELYLSLGFDSTLVHYIGSIGGEVVAASSVYLGGGVAGIYNVATLESARRQGVGAAMTAVPLLEARAAGYRVGTLEASESGDGVYRRLGFQEYCRIYHYIRMVD